MSTNLTTEEQQWADNAGQALRVSETQLDTVIMARLRAARAVAVEQASPSRAAPMSLAGWSWQRAMSAGAALGLALLVWALLPRSGTLPEATVNLAGVNALELMTDEQGPEFFQDLDLYLWLEEPGEAGDGRA